MPQSVKVLIVDDDELMREANARFLRSNGYQVLESATGDQGVTTALEEQPDIILLDVVLPDTSGVDVCVTLRRELVENDAMIALMSAVKLSPEDRSSGFESGADAYIARPVGNRELLARVSALERIQYSRRQLRQAVHQREELVRKLHHRMKNDLYTVESFISLRQEAVSNPECSSILEDLKHRVHSIAAIHESLYQSGDLVNVDVAAYLENLMAAFNNDSVVSSGRVRIVTKMETMQLDADVAIVIGMTATELVANALIHAFPQGRTGTVHVELAKRESMIVMVVMDDGTGFEDEALEAHEGAMGLRIVSMLLEGQNGTLKRTCAQGTRYEITFNPVAP